MNLTVLEIKPAYCRKYDTIESFKNDFLAGKDFLAGSHFSILDIDYIKENYETCYIKIDNKIVYIVRFGKIEKWVKNGKQNILAR